jgi:HNH endonuclease
MSLAEDRVNIKVLLAAFYYDPLTGIFIRRAARDKMGRPIAGIGKRSDLPHKNGYYRVAFNCTRFWAHRLAWLFMTGSWPPVGLDVEHRDHVKANNRWNNLRLATRQQNGANMKVRRGRKTKGIDFNHRLGKWRARIKINYKEHVLGYFETQYEAQYAYNKASKKAHGKFAGIVCLHSLS